MELGSAGDVTIYDLFFPFTVFFILLLLDDFYSPPIALRAYTLIVCILSRITPINVVAIKS